MNKMRCEVFVDVANDIIKFYLMQEGHVVHLRLSLFSKFQVMCVCVFKR